MNKQSQINEMYHEVLTGPDTPGKAWLEEYLAKKEHILVMQKKDLTPARRDCANRNLKSQI